MRITHVIRDRSRGIDLVDFQLAPNEENFARYKPQWKLIKRRLQGGRQSGVDLVEVDSGAMKFTLVVSRGLSIWSGDCDQLRLGWDSWEKEIVHPDRIELSDRGGLGWLDGFGGWIVRCGMASIGPPCTDRGEALTLHGRVDYLAAHYIEIVYEDEPAPRIFIRGRVREDLRAAECLELYSETSIEIGSRELCIADRIVNAGQTACEMQMLYHINLGPPMLGRGSRLVAPIRTIEPRDSRAAETPVWGWTTFDGPQPAGYEEQAYFVRLRADENNETEAMLCSPAGNAAALLKFNVNELPCFTLWKNEAQPERGYVAGLEPGTSFPNTRLVEREAERVVRLDRGDSHRMALRLKVLTTTEEVQSTIYRISNIGHDSPPKA